MPENTSFLEGVGNLGAATTAGTALGAPIGAAIGSVGGPLGALLGAGVGGLAGLVKTLIDWRKYKNSKAKQKKEMERLGLPFPKDDGMLSNKQEGDILSGYKPYAEQISRYRPSELALKDKYIQELSQSPANFGPLREQAERRFKEETVPFLSEQFAGGRFPNSSGSGLPNALGRAGGKLQSDLAAHEQNFNAEREGRLQQAAFAPSFENVYVPGSPGLLQQLAPQAIKYAGEALPGIIKQGNEWWNNWKGTQPVNQATAAPANSNDQAPLSQFSFKENPLGSQMGKDLFKDALNKQLGGSSSWSK